MLSHSPPHTISVVLCTYTIHRYQYLKNAIRSLMSQETLPHEIIVIVDHNDDLFNMVRADFPTILVHKSFQQSGLAGSRNTGIVQAGGDIVAFMDDDAAADPLWLSQLQAVYEDPDILGAGGTIEGIWEAGRPSWFPREFDWVNGCTFRGMPDTRMAVGRLIGCNMSFRRNIFALIGGFHNDLGRNDKFPLAGEETEFCLRLHSKNPETKLIYEPTARVFHQVPQDRGTWKWYFRRCYAEGLSKAQILAITDKHDSLDMERIYTLRTLPKAFIEGLSDTFIRFDIGGIQRSAALVVGFSATFSGYLIALLLRSARLTMPFKRNKQPVAYSTSK